MCEEGAAEAVRATNPGIGTILSWTTRPRRSRAENVGVGTWSSLGASVSARGVVRGASGKDGVNGDGVGAGASARDMSMEVDFGVAVGRR